MGNTLAHDISEASTSLLLQMRTLCLREVHDCIYDLTTSEQACCWLWTRDFHLSLNRLHCHSGCCPFRGPQALVSQLASSLATVNIQNCGSPWAEVLGGALHCGAQTAQLRQARAMAKPPSWKMEEVKASGSAARPGVTYLQLLYRLPAFADDQTHF